MEMTYHCINFNDTVRKVPKVNGRKAGRTVALLYPFATSNEQYKNGGKKMRLLGMDTYPSLNDIMEIRCNKCTRSEQGYDF